MRKLLKTFFIILFLLASGGQILAAQVSGSSVLVPSIFPQTPAPGEQVQISIQSFRVDLSRTNVKWALNNKILKSGIGERGVSFPMPESGVARVKVEVQEGANVYIQNYSFQTGTVDLVWEADTYTPPFFKGRALATPQSPVRAMAIADLRDSAGKKLDPSSLIYKWSLDGKQLPQISGLGKSVANIRPNSLGSANLGVEVSNLAGNIAASKRLSIRVSSPQLVVYQDRPIQGVNYDKALGNKVELLGSELTVKAEPYYFSLPELASGNVGYEWTLGGKRVDPYPDNPSMLTFQASDATKGSFSVGVKISNLKELLQFAQAAFTIETQTSYVNF